MNLRVMERWQAMQLLPAEGNLSTMILVNKLREKLGMDEPEQEELGMITGVVCRKCRSPVENRALEGEEPKYYCIVCNQFVDTEGLENQTIWNRVADVPKEIDFTKAERGILIATVGKMNKDDKITPATADFWAKFIEAYPKCDQIDTEGEDVETKAMAEEDK